VTSFSVIIVAYNSASTIAECLKSVAASAKGHEVETIVVDNASPDATKKILRDQFPDVLLLENESNAGFAAAVNYGVRTTRHPYIVLLNPDTIVEEKFFSKCSEFFAAKPTSAILGPNLVDDKGKHQPSCWKTPTMLMTLVEMLLPYKLSIDLVTDNPAIMSEVVMVSGACLVIRRDVFEREKGMDERFFMYYEDADLCYRVRKDGYHIFFNPSVNVFHKISGSGGKAEFLTMQYYKSKFGFFRKHYSVVYAAAVYLILIGGIFIRVPAYLTAGALMLNRKLLGLAKLYWYVAKNVGAVID
jgi:hypothetical protein